ncbi:SusC/RagA family TonB-linked outer membrane protein [Spirosoma sp. SC4-14]|uniref:SusC/RagA family TonB-linked outer membrane protein n=1 Tax=Spirosoma sp. SC4-14 TaxID=3128900 RepID=UPI0030CCCC45
MLFFPVYAQAQLVTGKVISKADGSPLPGVSVLVKGTTRGTISDAQGAFAIEAKTAEVLVFSAVGYEGQEVKVNASVLTISLAEDARALTEVVVTALGIKKEKEKILYATQEVKGAVLDKAPDANVAGNLTGKVAGLTVFNSSNLYQSPEIQLRGASTLLVVDGVPTTSGNYDLWNLNANDIESINVLKGTAAAALYGAAGINGAIMVTTKKGKQGSNGMEVTVNSSNLLQSGFLRVPETQDQYGMGYGGYYAFIDGKSGGGWNDDYGYVWGPKLNVKNPGTASGYEEYPQYNSPYNPNELYTFTQAGYTDQSHYKPLPWITRGKNNLTNFLNNELLLNNNVTISGKSDNTDYRISVSHLYQKGQVPNTRLNSTTLNLAGGIKITPKFRVESTLSYNRQYSPNYPQTGYGANNFFYNILLWMGPDVDINDLRDYWKPGGGRSTSAGFVAYGQPNVQQFNYNYTWYNNPWYIAYEATNAYTNNVLTGQVNGTYDITPNLSAFVRSGVITNTSADAIKTPYSYIYYGNGEFRGNYQENRRNNFQIVTDALLTYKKNFGPDFNLTASIGGSSRYNSSNYIKAKTQGLNVPALYTLSNSINPVLTANQTAEKMINSVYGYADFDYKRMIFLGITGRNDWTTSLQRPNNSYFYPSVSLGVVPTAMFTLPEVISYMKLRGSWAQVSTDNISLYAGESDGISGYESYYKNWYATLPTYQNGPKWNGNTSSLKLGETLISSGILPNTTISQEYGLDLRFLKNRIGLDVTYFNYTEKDFALRIPVSLASGYSNLLVNGDRKSRKGIEIMVSGTPIIARDFRWDVSANYSVAHQYVKEWYGGATYRNGVKVGDRTDVLRDWDWERSPDGQIVYGSNGFPQYVNHPVNIGLTDPDFIFGLSNTLKYKNFNLSFSFDGRVGGVMYNSLEQKLYEGGMHPGTANSYRDDAYEGKKTYVGQGVVVTGGLVEYDVQGKIVSDTRTFSPNAQAVNYIDWVNATYVAGVPGANINKRTFVKLREVVLAYQLPALRGKAAFFKTASVSLIGRNLLLFTKAPFLDPDGFSGDGGLSEPTYRNIGLNLNLKF